MNQLFVCDLATACVSEVIQACKRRSECVICPEVPLCACDVNGV